MKRTTIFLPEELHDRLREEAFAANVSMAELIRGKLATGDRRQRRPAPKKDILSRLEGIIENGTLTQNIDEEIYDL